MPQFVYSIHMVVNMWYFFHFWATRNKANIKYIHKSFYEYISFVTSKNGISFKSGDVEVQDGRGVSGSYTNLLPGPIWNYN